MSQMQRETPRELNKFVVNSEVSRTPFQWNNPTKLEVWYAHFLKRLTFLMVLIHLLSIQLSKYYIVLYGFSDIHLKLLCY